MRCLVKIRKIFLNFYWWFKSLFWIRDKKMVLFGAWFGNRFADTTRYLYQYLFENKQQLGLSKVVWVTRSHSVYKEMCAMGYEVYMMDSKESIYYHKKAYYHIICNFSESSAGFLSDIIGKYSHGAIKINLWHGVMPMKGVGCASNEYKNNKKNRPRETAIKEWCILHSALYRKFFLSDGGWGNSYYLSTTSAGTEILQKFFLLPQCKFIETANPRVCSKFVMTSYEKKVMKIIQQYEKIVLYVPTFRNANSTFDYLSVSNDLIGILKQKNGLFVQKAHSATVGADNQWSIKDNVLNLPSEFDLNILIPQIDILITDYSSVAADAMYYKKKILYYMPDYEEYVKEDRGFVVEPESVMTSEALITKKQLKESLIESMEQTFLPDYKYECIRKKYWGDDKSMYDIWEDIKNVNKNIKRKR